jgi:hypothetical protein
MDDRGKRFEGVEMDFSGLGYVGLTRRTFLMMWEAYQAKLWEAHGEGPGARRLFPTEASIGGLENRIWSLIELDRLKIIDPGIIRKVANFSRAVVEDVKTGRKRVSNEVRTHRMTICRSCELYNLKKGTCKHPKCGCVMQKKTRWSSSECPIGRWGKHQPEEREHDRGSGLYDRNGGL